MDVAARDGTKAPSAENQPPFEHGVQNPAVASGDSRAPRDLIAGHAVVEVLAAEGVRIVYGLPGGHVLPIYDGLYDTPDIAHVLVRHEQAAANMAAAWFQLTGEAAVVLVTAGPGATNLASGVAEAFVGSIPMVILAGRGATATTHRGASQEIATDQLFRPITKWSVRVDRADLIPQVLRQAFATARNGRPGPVYIDLPRDILTETIAFGPYTPAGSRIRVAADADRIAEAGNMLLGAKAPLIVAGGGVIAAGAWDAVRDLAESMAIPVITSLAGRGTIADDHPLSVGGMGAHRNPLSKRLLGDADVVLSIGARFEEMETNWRKGFVPSPSARVIQVDIDAAEIGRSVPASLAVVGDARLTIEALAEYVRARGRALDSDSFRAHARTRGFIAEMKKIAADVGKISSSTETPTHPLRVIAAIRQALPRNAVFALDVGCITQHMGGSIPAFPIYEPRSLIVPSSFYGMSFAGSALPVAKQVYPNRPAVGLVGDGSFQMMLHVLAMAAEYKLGVTWCVLNDQALGSIRDIQEFGMKNRIIDTDFKLQPDFARLAEACGCYGEKVDRPAGIEAALARALNANADGIPAVLDFPVARTRMDQTYEHYLFYGRS